MSIMARNARTFERLKKMIIKGTYNKEEMLLDMTDFLGMGTLTEKEFSDLLELIELNPPMEGYSLRTGIDENGYMVSDSTFLLMHKQICRQVYSAEIVEQLVTDFKITGAISREQFTTLLNTIDEIYYPVFEEEHYPEMYVAEVKEEAKEPVEKPTKKKATKKPKKKK